MKAGTVGEGVGFHVGVIVGVLVGVLVGVSVGVSVGVLERVPVDVELGLGVVVGEGVGVHVGVIVGVLVGVNVGVSDGVPLGVSVDITAGPDLPRAGPSGLGHCVHMVPTYLAPLYTRKDLHLQSRVVSLPSPPHPMHPLPCLTMLVAGQAQWVQTRHPLPSPPQHDIGTLSCKPCSSSSRGRFGNSGALARVPCRDSQVGFAVAAKAMRQESAGILCSKVGGVADDPMPK